MERRLWRMKIYSIRFLADLKRTVREYTTAATESNCPAVRRVFNDLTMDTLRIQGELYMQMSQMNMYAPPGKALRQDVDKQIQSAQQTQQKLQQFVREKNRRGRSL
ncbi:spore coat protein [Paenibacillus rhizoplanae]